MLALSAICPSQRVLHEDSSQNRKWRRFLNDLCWFCDTDLGSKTITALVVSRINGALSFWMASNHEQAKRKEHLTWLFDELKQADKSSVEDRKALTDQVLSKSVSISHKKVKNHIWRLERFLDEAVKSNVSDDRTFSGETLGVWTAP
ncbi:hypothetical protein LTR49_026129 [Elasticomyces elasticus]|nr:hypothetical protein LTR49_026129 [Elasticomyces elasticus]